MKKLFLFLIPFILFAYRVDILTWRKHYTFYQFLKDNNLPFSVYYNLNPRIKRKVRNIYAGEKIFILKNNNNFKQALIPIDNKNQLQIIKTNNKIITKIVPIIYDTIEKKANITIKHYLSYDVYKATGSILLSQKLISIFKDKVNFRTIPKNTKISIIYDEKLRFGSVKDIKILFASISNKYYHYMAFLNPKDGRYYDQYGRSLRGMFLPAPLKYIRISSYFGMRFHPILHKWLMHEGIDYVNKVGTPIHAVADGRIIYKGWIRGYGKSVEIRHKDGYMTLYAHLHGWPKNIHVGEWVKQGTVIGYLGDTGLSTGPHLHFGVMHYGRWINPLKLKNSAKIILRGKAKKRYIAYIRQFIKSQNLSIALK